MCENMTEELLLLSQLNDNICCVAETSVYKCLIHLHCKRRLLRFKTQCRSMGHLNKHLFLLHRIMEAKMHASINVFVSDYGNEYSTNWCLVFIITFLVSINNQTVGYMSEFASMKFYIEKVHLDGLLLYLDMLRLL